MFQDADLYKLLAECNNWMNLFHQGNCANITSNDNLEVKDNVTYMDYKSKNVSRVKSLSSPETTPIVASSASSTSSASFAAAAAETKKVELLSFENVTEFIDSLGKPRLIPTIQIAKRHLELQNKLSLYKDTIADLIPSNVFVKENGILSSADFGDVSNPKTHSSFCKPSSIMWNLMKKIILDILTDPCEIEIMGNSGVKEIQTPETVFWPVWLYTWTVYELVSEFPIFSNKQQQQEDETFLWFVIGKWILRQIEYLSLSSIPLMEKRYTLSIEKYLNPFHPSIFTLSFIHSHYDELDALDVVSKFVYHSTMQSIRFCCKNLYVIADKYHPGASKILVKFNYSSSTSACEELKYLFSSLMKLKLAGGFHRLEKWILHCILHANFQNRVIANSLAIDLFSSD